MKFVEPLTVGLLAAVLIFSAVAVAESAAQRGGVHGSSIGQAATLLAGNGSGASCGTACVSMPNDTAGFTTHATVLTSASCPTCPFPGPSSMGSNARQFHPSSSSVHYWTGANYSGTSTTATYVYTTIGTPSSAPRYNDVYYELLSAWDSNGKYDQIGLSSYYCATTLFSTCDQTDEWNIIYSVGGPSTGSGCVMTYSFDPDVSSLSVFQDYTFGMVLDGTNLAFQVYYGSSFGGTVVWSHAVTDSAANFGIALTHNCQGTNLYGFQVYQEVYDVSNSMSFPQWNSGFANTYEGTTSVSTWNIPWSSGAPTSPHGYVADAASSSFVRIDNVAFWIGFNPYTQTIAQGGHNTISGTINADGSYCSGTSCPFTPSCTFPTGSTGSSSSSFGTADVPDSSTSYTTYISGSATVGDYYSGCTITVTSTTPNEFSTFIFLTGITT